MEGTWKQRPLIFFISGGLVHWPDIAVDHVGQCPGARSRCEKEGEWIWRDKEKTFGTVRFG